MKFTSNLYKQNYRYLFKQNWKFHQSKIKGGHLNKPIYLQKEEIPTKSGIDVIKQSVNKFNKWEPPVNDPRFSPALLITDHPDYHQKFIYEFNNSSCLVEGEKQAIILTKSKPFFKLPSSVIDLLGRTSLTNQDLLMQQIIMYSHKLEATKVKLPRRKNLDLPIWKYKAEFGIPSFKTSELMLDGVIRILNQLLFSLPQLLISRTFVSDLHLFSHYSYNNSSRISIKGNVDHMILCSEFLPPFASKDDLKNSDKFSFPSIYPLAPTIDFTLQHIWKDEILTGFKPDFKFKHPHTLFLCHEGSWTSSQLNAKSLMFLMGHTVALAKQLFGSEVGDLPRPLSAQCILTDGIKFTFTCFQLNSLDFKSRLKNLVWFDSENQLFEKIIPKRGMLRHTKYINYNHEVLKKIISFYLYGNQQSEKDFYF